MLVNKDRTAAAIASTFCVFVEAMDVLESVLT
jgi:hypothetical protein